MFPAHEAAGRSLPENKKIIRKIFKIKFKIIKYIYSTTNWEETVRQIYIKNKSAFGTISDKILKSYSFSYKIVRINVL